MPSVSYDNNLTQRKIKINRKEVKCLNFFTVREVSEKLKISEYTIAAWLRSGKLRGTQLAGRFWRVSEQALIDFTKENEVTKS